MKKHYYFILLFSLLCMPAIVQAQYYINFETDTFRQKLLTIDTVNYKRNNWQIGRPSKPFIDSAFSKPNAIVTDTSLPYTPFDTSVFVLKLARLGPLGPNSSFLGILWYLGFKYSMQKDTGDIAMVEVSFDTGQHWTNLADSLPIYLFSWTNNIKPNLAKDSVTFGMYELNMHLYPEKFDSLWIRFTFIADSNNHNKDGWMIDDMQWWYFAEDVAKLNYQADLISLYPNPSAGYVYIERKTKERRNEQVVITDMKGAIVYQTTALPANGMLQHHLPAGQYLLKYTAGDSYTVRKLVVQ